jgi:hypothetical protein
MQPCVGSEAKTHFHEVPAFQNKVLSNINKLPSVPINQTVRGRSKVLSGGKHENCKNISFHTYNINYYVNNKIDNYINVLKVGYVTINKSDNWSSGLQTLLITHLY